MPVHVTLYLELQLSYACTQHCVVFHRIVECLSLLLKQKGKADPPVTIRWAKTEINK